MSDTLDFVGEAPKGWWFPQQYRGKCHWSDGSGKSLCGKWNSRGVPSYAFDDDPGNADPKQDCAECRRRLNKIRGVA